MYFFYKQSCFFIMLLFLFASIVRAEQGWLQVKMTDVAVFKNGYAFIKQEGTGTPAEGGYCFLEKVPQAVLGTFFASSARENIQLEEITATVVETQRKEECKTIEALLEANNGRECILSVDDEKFTGRIGKILSGNEEGAADKVTVESRSSWETRWGWLPAASGARYTREQRAKPAAGKQEKVMLFEFEDNQTLAVPVKKVKYVTFLEKDIARIRSVNEEKNRLLFKLNNPNVPVRINIAYLTRGIRWIPAYTISRQDNDRAEISLNALVINENQDIRGSRLHLVVGVPHFMFQESISPLSMQTTFATLSSFFSSRSHRGGGHYNMMSNMLVSQVAMPAYSAPEENGGIPDDLAPEAMDELHLYTREQVFLKKGETASFNLLRTSVPYESMYIYKTSAEDWWERRVTYYNRRRPENELQEALERDKVWHAVRLNNTTAQPWTTGTAMTLMDKTIAGQDILTYTPSGKKVDVKTTVAIDIFTDLQEEELERKANVMHGWDLVKFKAQLKITNHKKKRIRITVTRGIWAMKLWDAGDAEVQPAEKYLRRGNTRYNLNWEFFLKPGEMRTLSHEFSAYTN